MKIGLFFGTFNPIHIGHLIIAHSVQQTKNLDQVWFIVTPHNPLKEKKTLLADHHRYNMVQLALEDTPNLKVSNVEFNLPQPNYTVTTLAKLKELFPKHEFSLIMGEDNLRSLNKWFNYNYIIENYKLLVYPRNYTAEELILTEKLSNDFQKNKNVEMLDDIPLMKISSSYIRNLIKNKKDVRFLLSDSVYKYLDEMNFYR
jgi:nicotinate-nucleotide adenylyltransferase